MPQEVLKQTNFNGGELDPRMLGRTDLKAYYTMIAAGENVETSPIGTLLRRPGTVFVDYARHVLQPVNYGLDMILTANGGDPAELLAPGQYFETEQDLGPGDHWLVTIDFGAAVEISAVDVIDYCVKPEVSAEPPAPPPFEYPYNPPVFEGPIDIGPIFEGDLP